MKKLQSTTKIANDPNLKFILGLAEKEDIKELQKLRYDELILDSSEKDASLASKILKEEMENAVKLAVPLTVECKIGKSWFDAK